MTRASTKTCVHDVRHAYQEPRKIRFWYQWMWGGHGCGGGPTVQGQIPWNSAAVVGDEQGHQICMTGRGRGRPPKVSPSPTPPPGAPADPNAARFPVPPSLNIMGIPSFTTDILNQLPPPKQTEMIALVNRFKSKQLSIQEFLAISKTLLGERLYTILAQGMSQAVRVPGQAGPLGDPFPRPMHQMMRPPNMPMPMPQLYNQAGTAQTQTSAAGQQQQQADDFGDVTKMDSSSLQDVIQYSGIDLRAEAEMIESELHVPAAGYAASAATQDLRIRPEYYFNMARMKAIVYMAAKARGVAVVNDQVFELLALALQRRLLNIITGMTEISKHRVDAGRLGFKIKVENDPKKQMWLLEKIYEEQLEREQEELLQGQPSKSAEAEKAKAKKAAAAEKKTGEDVIVKTRLANTTAMQALGLQQKSWMTAGIVGLQQQAQSAAKQTGEADSEASQSAGIEGNVKIPLHFSQAPSVTPVTDRDLLMQGEPMESCFTCKVVSTGATLGVAGYLGIISNKYPQHKIFLRGSAITFIAIAGMNWWIRTTQEQAESAKNKNS